MGRMKEAHEVERILKQLLGLKVPKEEIQKLPLGTFYAAIGNEVKKTYVLPAGVPEEIGQKVAIDEISPEYVRDTYLKPSRVLEGEDLTYKPLWEEEKRKREELEKQFADIRTQVYDELKEEADKWVKEERQKAFREAMEKVEEIKKQWNVEGKEKKIADLTKELEGFRELKGALAKILPVQGAIEPTKETVNLEHKELVINVSHQGEEVVTMATRNIEGQILYCAVNDLPKEGFSVNEMNDSLMENGWAVKTKTLYTKLSILSSQGRLVKTDKGYRLPQKVRFNIEKVEGK
jgi:hypothetical protein